MVVLPTPPEPQQIRIRVPLPVIAARLRRPGRDPPEKPSAARSGEARAGENVGVLLRGKKKGEVERGQVLAKPGSIKPHTKFKAQIYVLNKDEGGRHTPFFSNYRPQFFFRTSDITGSVNALRDSDDKNDVEMAMPGDNVVINVELGQPVAMEEGLTFAIREGGRTIGSGRVIEVVE